VVHWHQLLLLTTGFLAFYYYKIFLGLFCTSSPAITASYSSFSRPVAISSGVAIDGLPEINIISYYY